MNPDRAEQTDSELIQASEREPEAFGVVYDRHVKAVLAFLLRRTADPDLAADLTAETFAEAFSSRRRFRREAYSARPWLFGIARHELSRFLRRGRVDETARRRLGLSRLEVDETSFERIEALADFQPVKEAVQIAIQSLPPKQAEAVFLRVGLELSYADVAQRLGCTQQAARVSVARGMTRLADALDELA